MGKGFLKWCDCSSSPSSTGIEAAAVHFIRFAGYDLDPGDEGLDKRSTDMELAFSTVGSAVLCILASWLAQFLRIFVIVSTSLFRKFRKIGIGDSTSARGPRFVALSPKRVRFSDKIPLPFVSMIYFSLEISVTVRKYNYHSHFRCEFERSFFEEGSQLPSWGITKFGAVSKNWRSRRLRSHPMTLPRLNLIVFE